MWSNVKNDIPQRQTFGVTATCVEDGVKTQILAVKLNNVHPNRNRNHVLVFIC